MIGSACFVLGSVPAYLDAVGTTVDGVTYFVGSIFFTSASLGQLLQAQTPEMTGVDEQGQHRPTRVRWRAWLPHDRNWLAAASQFPGTLFFNVSTFAALADYTSFQDVDQQVWRPDFFGSTLFLVASAFALLALEQHGLRQQLRTLPGQIAWINMLGSILFMLSAIAAFVLPSGVPVDDALAVGGTLFGAVCFLVGAALMFPAWRHEVRSATTGGDRP
ncbi:hypothetical protein [Nocardioides sp.]|uniref:hypothetical protein n=1 Tax=Nocardioides sp. TaxID=35761 RepID=UPI003784DF9C